MLEPKAYTTITKDKQYFQYCDLLERLVFSNDHNVNHDAEIDLLTQLIENYDKKAWSIPTMNPVELLQSIMKENDLKPQELENILGFKKGVLCEILYCKKSISKEVARKLAEYFKVRKERFLRSC